MVIVLGGLFFTAMSVPSRARGTDAIALVTSMKGKVEVRRADLEDFQAVRLGHQLFEEDVLRTYKNAGASLLLFDGSVVTIYPNSRLVLSSKKMDKKKSSVMASLSKGVLNSMKAVFSPSRKKETLTAVPGIRKKIEAEAEGVRVLYPRNSVILTSTPNFRWQLGSRGRRQMRFRVSLTLKGINGKLWTIQTAGTEISYPKGGKELAPGQTYFIRVENQSDAGLYDEAYFMVLDDKTKQEVQRFAKEMEKMQRSNPSDISPLIMLAVYYKEKGLFHEALVVLEKLDKKKPEEKFVLEEKRSVYAKIGFWNQWEAVNQKLQAMK
jgi:hypothetical protein